MGSCTYVVGPRGGPGRDPLCSGGRHLGTNNSRRMRLQSRVTCPHCWHLFAPEDVLWIAQHPDLLGDARLGPEQPQRFLPSRFTVDGNAIDPRGMTCHDLACPRCHLLVPRAMLEMQPFFVSILGTPACGKSYFLTSMTWQLRRHLPKYFCMALGDADPAMNRSLTEYEELQFLNADPDKLVAIRKTELQGELYNSVLFGDQSVSYARPFIFSLTPLDDHPNFGSGDRLARALCLYDNAGEHFLPGADTATSPVTRHLALSAVLFYLFDPTQDPRFREACRGRTHDPQMLDRARTNRQEVVLAEAANRIRRYVGLEQSGKHSRPLVVVVTKYDAWCSLLNNEQLRYPCVVSKSQHLAAIDLESIEGVSNRVRQVLWQYSPELVAAAEGFAQSVTYIPVSAIGRNPEVDPQTGLLGVRPRDIRPVWADVPLLYAMCCWMSGVIPYFKRATAHRASASQPSSKSAAADGSHKPRANDAPRAIEGREPAA